MTTITKLVLLPNVNAALDILARFFDGEPEGVYDARGRKVLRAARAELAQFTDAVDATLTPRELAHVMAVAFTAPHDCEDVDGGPLDSAEIDALCERLNSGGESEAEAHRREIGPEAWEHQKVRCEGTCGRTFHPMELDENWKCRDCRGA